MRPMQVIWGIQILVVFVICCNLTQANYYDDLLIDDLYKRLDALDGYFADDYQPQIQNDWMDENIQLNSRESGQTDLRDHEYLEHSASKGGFQYISGGAGEGSQHLTPEGTQNNTQEVKSDETLPFYCHPPNPCPKGFTAEDGCDEGIKDTAEAQKKWISGLMERAMCTCDEEHMFSCPKDTSEMARVKESGESSNLDRLLNNLMQGSVVNPYYSKDNRHETLVAKKSPGMFKRSIKQKQAAKKNRNPYLQGDKIRTVAKKGVLM